tara:strand:+ start:188409 stop:189299 length:891 start_codon:yes stop_codon:yes gene_type:complete
MFSIIAPVFLLASVGAVWARLGYDYPSEFVARIVMNVGAPCLFVSAMAGADINLDELGMVIAAALAIMFSMLLIAYPFLRYFGFKVPVYLPPLLFPNNGNIGLSLCLFTFGEKGLAFGLGIFMLMTVSQFTLGIFLVNDSAVGVRARMLELARQPIVYAAGFAVFCVATGYALPPWANNTVSLMGDITIPLMLVTLGVSLARLKVANFPRTVLFSSIRLFGGFLLGLMVVYLFQLEGVIRGVVLIQASMPVAVFNYLLAVRYKQSPTETASIVIISTLMAFLLLPVLLLYVMPATP